MLCRATSESWHGHPPKKLPAPLASTTSRSNVCKDGCASLRAPSYACKTAGIQTLGRVRIWAGHSMSAIPTRAHLGHAPARVRRALAARWAGLPGERRSLVASGVWMFSGVSLWDVVRTWVGIRPRSCHTHGCRSASQQDSWTGGSEFSRG